MIFKVWRIGSEQRVVCVAFWSFNLENPNRYM